MGRKIPLRWGFCEFCGKERELSDEHALGDWLNRAFPGFTERAGVNFARWEGDPASHRVWITQDVFGHTIPNVCVRCNNSWMSRLEAAAVPTVGEMARGQKRLEMDRHAQRRLATWIAKTVCVIDLDGAPRAVPKEHRRFLYNTRSQKERRPPENVQVWIGACASEPGDLEFLSHIHPSTESDPLGSIVEPYVATMVLGQLLMRLIYDPAPIPTIAARQVAYSAHLIRIWPTDRTVIWPPVAVLQRPELDAFVRVIAPPPPQSGQPPPAP